MGQKEKASRIPRGLKQEPLVEAIWELRFDLKEDVAGELLVGMIYQKLKKDYPRIVRLCAADIPRPILQSDPRLRYVPTIRLEGKEGLPLAVQVGDHLVSLNNRRPYRRWKEFSKRIRDLLGVLQETELIESFQSFSLRYIDLLELEPPPSLQSLQVRLELAGQDLAKLPVQLRTEIEDPPFVHIVQINSYAQITLGNETLQGTLIDITAVQTLDPEGNGWAVLNEQLDSAHSRTHRLFFTLLTPEAITRLEPEYE